MKRMRGAALLWVVWILLIGTAVVSLSLQVSASHQAYASLGRRNSQDQALADAGMALAIAHVDPRSGWPETWLPDNRIHTLTFEGATLHLRVSDESARIDLNDAPAVLLTAYWQACGLPDRISRPLSAAILARRADVNALATPSSENRDAVHFLDYPRSWHSVAELHALPGVPQNLPHACLDDLTVYAQRSSPVPTYASPKVKAAMALQGQGLGLEPGASSTSLYRIQVRVDPERGPSSQWFGVIRLVPFDPAGRGYRVLSWQRGDGN